MDFNLNTGSLFIPILIYIVACLPNIIDEIIKYYEKNKK